jgi:hypothetical protein
MIRKKFWGHEKRRISDERSKRCFENCGNDSSGLFVFMVAAPLVMKLAGITYGIITGLIFLAILLIKVAVVLAIGYLILVGIRALLR